MRLLRTLLLLYGIFVIVSRGNCVPSPRMCIEYSDENSRQDDDNFDEYPASSDGDDAVVGIESSIVPNSPQTPQKVKCQSDFDFCFGLWLSDDNGTKTVKQGCWRESGDRNITCLRRRCISVTPAGTTGNQKLFYCCCSGDLCNENMIKAADFYTLTPSRPIVSTSVDIDHEKPVFWFAPILLFGLTLALVFIVAVVVLISCRVTEIPGSETSPLAPSGPGYSSNLHNVDNLKLCGMIGRGKYGTVWKGLINEQAVAVKIFPEQHKQYFINERNIYSLPLMENSALLIYFGFDERRTLDDHVEYFLVLSLAPLGCLQDWLIDNVMSFSILCKMTQSITHGLSHLHTELHRGEDVKPCISHRDLNTRNILVNADFSCCIADFGFALKLFGSKYEYKGEVALAETKSINEVGTLRYMAPEILEGAVNLRDCETSLKQMDIYSLGLVIWEIATRCVDFYPQGKVVPAYKAPYELEVGQHPTFEQMQVLVARHKARPLFPPGWGGGPAGKLIKDTCEDCWDHDAEARLTSLCAEERMQELANLRARLQIGQSSSPLLNTSNNLGNNSPERRLRSFSSISCNSDAMATSVAPPPNQQIIPRVKSCGNESTAPISSLTTLISSQMHHTEKNHLMYPQLQIQPFQGRNPCQERNLAPANNRAIQVLVEKSKKHSFQNGGQENSLSCLEDDVSVEDLIAVNSKKFTSDSSSMGQGFPKQNNTDKNLRGWHGVRALIQKKLFRKDTTTNVVTQTNVDEKSNLVENRIPSPTKGIFSNPVDNTTCSQQINEQTKHFDQTALECFPGKRPNNLDLDPMVIREEYVTTPEKNKNFTQNFSDELGCSVVKTPSEANLDTRISTPTRLVTKSLSTNLIKNVYNNNIKNNSNNSELNQKISSICVAASAPTPPAPIITADRNFRRQRSLEVFREVFSGRGSTDKLRDPSQRVKTPGDVPPSVRKVRASKTLSLYDDRMMDSSMLNIL